MADNSKKSRKSNFSQEEVDILVKTVGKNYDILYGEYSKRAIYKSARHQAWMDVTNEVNQVSFEKRTLQEVKNKWKKCQHLYRGEDCMDISDEFDSMPLEQRLKSPVVPSTSDQEQFLHSHPLSPTKLKVTRQSKPKELSPKPVTPLPVEEICLKWNSHHGNMQSMFPTLLLKEQYVDATLVAEGQSLKCHRMILSSCSPYFEEILSNISPFQHPVLFMKDTPFWILKCLCDFMYTGEVLISQDKLNELLSAAESLKIKGLTGKPDVPNEDLLKEPLSKHIKEEKKDDFNIDKEPEKKEVVKEKKRHSYAAAALPSSVPEPAPPKNSKIPKASEPPPVKTSKIPKLNAYTEPPVVKSSSKLTKVNTSHVETVPTKTTTSKVLRSSSTLKKIERADKTLIKEAISKGDILDPFDLLEPVYEEVQKEPKPPCTPNKTKEATKNVPVKKGVQKKVKKRKISDDRDESPPPVLSRKGTRSRPNKKIPRFYHSGFDNSTPKIHESPDTTIVREPHTSQAESHNIRSHQTEIHADPTDPQLESHMDQTDPLFQLADIKAEPFDLEDSTIEIEDNVVTFSEPDTSLTEEELLEESFEPVMNFDDKTVLKDKQVSKPFKKIRVTRQVLIDVEKPSMVKLVDVDKIKVSADPLEEDPLNLPSNLDTSIKIMNVETINENVQNISAITSNSTDKEPSIAESSEVGFKICSVSSGSLEEEKQLEENPLGFHIANVVSEIEEKEGGQEEDNASTLPVCQIAEVFTEKEGETSKTPVNDGCCEKVIMEETNFESISESSIEKTGNILLQDSFMTEKEDTDVGQPQEETPKSAEGFDFSVTPRETENTTNEKKSGTFTFASNDNDVNSTNKVEDNNDNCSDLNREASLPNIEVSCGETSLEAASDILHTTVEDEMSAPKELQGDLNEASVDSCRALDVLEQFADGESKTTSYLKEISDDLDNTAPISIQNFETNDEPGTSAKNPVEIIKDSDNALDDKTAESIQESSIYSDQTPDGSDQIIDSQIKIVDDPNKIEDQTAGDASEVRGDFEAIAHDSEQTHDDQGKLTKDSLQTVNSDSNLESVKEIAEQSGETSVESEDACAIDQTQITTDSANTRKVPSVKEYISNINIQESSANIISPHESEILEVRSVEGVVEVSVTNDEVIKSSRHFELMKPDICTNSVESNPCLEDTFDQAIVSNDLTTNEDMEMPTDECHTKDPVLANAVPYTNEDLPVASSHNDVLPMEVGEEGFSQGEQSFDQTPNSFELADVTQNDSSSYSTPGFHIAQVISEQIALNEGCRLTNQPMDTSDECFEGSMTTSNELEMIVNDLTKIVGDSQRLDSNMEHEDITESLENLLEK